MIHMGRCSACHVSCEATATCWPCYVYVHIHVVYFSVNLLQDMEIVILKTIKGIQHIEYKYTKLKRKFLSIKNNIQ
jgi:hypothetical protein